MVVVRLRPACPSSMAEGEKDIIFVCGEVRVVIGGNGGLCVRDAIDSVATRRNEEGLSDGREVSGALSEELSEWLSHCCHLW